MDGLTGLPELYIPTICPNRSNNAKLRTPPAPLTCALTCACPVNVRMKVRMHPCSMRMFPVPHF